MISNITAFGKEWYKDTEISKVREINSRVKVVMSKNINDAYIGIYLDFDKNVDIPTMFNYGLKSSRNAILLKTFEPKDNNGTDEDIKSKISEVVNAANKAFDSVQEHHVVSLIQYIKEYDIAVHNICKIKEQISGAMVETIRSLKNKLVHYD